MKKNNLPLTIKKTLGLAVSPTAKNTYISFVGHGLFSFFTMLATVLVSRSLGPAQFGIFSVLFSLAVILFDVSSFGLDQGLIRFVSFNLARGRTKRAREYVKAIFNIRVAAAICLIFLGPFLSPFLSKILFDNLDYRWLLTLVFISTANIILVGGFISAFLRARQDFLTDAIFHGTRGIFRAFLIFLFFLFKKLTLISAVLVFSLYHWIFLPLTFLFIPREFLKAKPKKEVFEKLFHFSKWIYLWALTATLHSKLDIFMLEKMKGSFTTGIYSAAGRPIVVFITLVNSFNVVLLPKLSSIKTIEHFSSFFKKIILALGGVVVFILLGIFFAKPLILLLFGSAYSSAIEILRLLLLGVVFMALGLPFMSSLTAWGKTKAIGLISTGQLVLVFFSNLILIDKFGGMGAAITYNLSNIFAFLVSLVFYLRELKRKRRSYER